MNDTATIEEMRDEIDELIDILKGYKDNGIPVNIKSVDNTVKIMNRKLDCDNIIFDSIMNDDKIIAFLGIKVYRGLESITDYIHRHYIYINPENDTIYDIAIVQDNDF